MSLFRSLGKTVEKTKHNLLGDSDPDYICTTCDRPLSDHTEYCPHCGEPTVEPHDEPSA